jgi:hypothetical protein
LNYLGSDPGEQYQNLVLVYKIIIFGYIYILGATTTVLELTVFPETNHQPSINGQVI